METEKYQALLIAIKTGSLAAAAKELDYTTSGVSRMIASLENELGVTLLNRSKKGVRPSSSCEQILPEIKELLMSADRLNKKSASLHGMTTGTIRIGTAYNYYYEALSQAIGHFTLDYPNVSIEIISSYSTDLAHQVDAHKLDLAIISQRENSQLWIPLYQDEMIAAVSPLDPLAENKVLSVADFSTHAYIQTHPHADSDSARIFKKHNIIPNVKYTTEDSMATFSMVAANLGITMNNKINALLWQNSNIKILPLRPKERIHIGLEVSNEANEIVQSFINTFLNYAKKQKKGNT